MLTVVLVNPKLLFKNSTATNYAIQSTKPVGLHNQYHMRFFSTARTDGCNSLTYVLKHDFTSVDVAKMTPMVGLTNIRDQSGLSALKKSSSLFGMGHERSNVTYLISAQLSFEYLL